MRFVSALLVVPTVCLIGAPFCSSSGYGGPAPPPHGGFNGQPQSEDAIDRNFPPHPAASIPDETLPDPPSQPPASWPPSQPVEEPTAPSVDVPSSSSSSSSESSSSSSSSISSSGDSSSSSSSSSSSRSSDPSPADNFLGTDLSAVDKDFINEGLKKLYRKKILPLEQASKFSHFSSPPMGPSDFEAKPMVLILGQYSVGKTSFIRSLLKRDFPGQRIGPEPTTDRFMALMRPTAQGQERLVPGHALVMQPEKPFRGLASFGNNFLSKFQGTEVNSAILRNITIIDSPGVLAGEKQRIGRDYDYTEVIRWFAERADLIVIMFDAHKLDISDELRAVLEALRPHQDKIRVLLNKADTVDAQALLRVYGALMWALGKVVQTPEVCRVYLGSFWEKPLKLPDNAVLLAREKADLIKELNSLPASATVRRINDLIKRARSVKVSFSFLCLSSFPAPLPELPTSPLFPECCSFAPVQQTGLSLPPPFFLSLLPTRYAECKSARYMRTSFTTCASKCPTSWASRRNKKGLLPDSIGSSWRARADIIFP